MQHGRQMIGRLPRPDDDSLAHGKKVCESIRQAIDEAGGSISFAQFMQLALYSPGLGYYNVGTTKFGAAGDFVTAPELSPLFGRVVARQCESVLKQLEKGKILELGAGSGRLAVEILRKLTEMKSPPERYLILEISADLKARQEELISEELPDLLQRVEWLSKLPEKFAGVVIANEVADALPVERFERTDAAVLQMHVTASETGFDWSRKPAPEMLAMAVEKIETDIGEALPPGYQSEISLGLPDWIGQIARCLDEGLVLLFDYGVSRREYYSRVRNQGWLRCHFRHHAHNEPLIYPGIQDLTSWVDFTAVAESAVDHGLDVAGYVTQAQFLINGGLEDELAGIADLAVVDQLELSRQVKLLTLPGEMGENFKCIGLGCGELTGVTAFSSADRAHTL
ncbi:MAG: SAM-dependent methyltransferase [Woeseiaceae bacterium]|nr:SAM-dependent methyltransferase [Woeseiaceae bacterium]